MNMIPMYKFARKQGAQGFPGVQKVPAVIPSFQKIIKKRKSDEQDVVNASSALSPTSGMDLSKLFDFGGKSTSGISKSKNHIYFYDDVTTETCLELNRTLIEMAKELQRHSLEYDTKPAKIYLHINSDGGELLACFSTVDYIKNCPIPVVSIIEGSAASAATLISCVCHERYMTPNSYMLIHQLRGGYWGKYDEMEEDFENSKKFMEKIYDIYEEHTKLGRKELKKILRKDEWWDYSTCLKYGLVDGFDNGWMHNKVVQKHKKPKFNRDDADDADDDDSSGSGGVSGSGTSCGGGRVKTRSMK
jgi:ATP-dependent protease ClpP protease subunit